MSSIGKIYTSILPYFDIKTRKIKYKGRPVLIIAEPIGADTEYTILPVSSISNPMYYNAIYDTELKLEDYPKLSLTKKSYIRSHKQTTVYKSSIDFAQCIGDVKESYPRIFTELTLQQLKHVGFLCTFTSKYTRKHIRLMSFHKSFTTNHSNE